MQLIWEEFLKIIKEEAGSQVVETWFKAVTFKHWDSESGKVILEAPNQFVSKWIQEHYLLLLNTHLSRLLHHNAINIQIGNKSQINQKTIIPASVAHDQPMNFKTTRFQPIKKPEPQKTNISNNITNNFTSKPKPNNTNTAKEPCTLVVVQNNYGKDREKYNNNLNELYTFDNFIVGPTNSLAHAAAYAIIDNLGNIYNPMFIYGGTGLGKTHLLHALGNEVIKRYPNAKIRYESTDNFVNEFINSIRFDRSAKFRKKYQDLDLLLIDDVQFLSNKEQTQEMFFHIFNNLYEQQKQIILSSDTFPNEIIGLQSRLKSRMGWGLVADIQIPDLETKIAILRKKATKQNITLDDEVSFFIASRALSNIRELEGALLRVSAFASLTNQPITIEMAKKVLLNLHDEKKKDGIQFDNILKLIAKHYGISPIDIKSKKRNKNISSIRQMTFYFMKKFTFNSLQSIGDYIGGRDHSTVIHAIGKVDGMLKTDAEFAQNLKTIEQKILMG